MENSLRVGGHRPVGAARGDRHRARRGRVVVGAGREGAVDEAP